MHMSRGEAVELNVQPGNVQLLVKVPLKFTTSLAGKVKKVKKVKRENSYSSPLEIFRMTIKTILGATIFG